MCCTYSISEQTLHLYIGALCDCPYTIKLTEAAFSTRPKQTHACGAIRWQFNYSTTVLYGGFYLRNNWFFFVFLVQQPNFLKNWSAWPTYLKYLFFLTKTIYFVSYEILHSTWNVYVLTGAPKLKGMENSQISGGEEGSILLSQSLGIRVLTSAVQNLGSSPPPTWQVLHPCHHAIDYHRVLSSSSVDTVPFGIIKSTLFGAGSVLTIMLWDILWGETRKRQTISISSTYLYIVVLEINRTRLKCSPPAHNPNYIRKWWLSTLLGGDSNPLRSASGWVL